MTMRLFSRGNLVKVHDLESLQKLLPALRNEDIDYEVLGAGSNFLLCPDPEFVLVQVDFPFDKSSSAPDSPTVEYPANVPLGYLTKLAIKHELLGWDCFTGIPAWLGGAAFMNAGTSLGEIKDLIKCIHFCDANGATKKHIVDKESYSYRKNHFLKQGDVIFKIELLNLGKKSGQAKKIKDYLKMRNQTQPLWSKNCGCVFKNPGKLGPSGQLIEQLGIKGLELKGLKISELHANFMENVSSDSQKPTLNDFLKLESIIQALMISQYGISLEREVRIFQNQGATV